MSIILWKIIRENALGYLSIAEEAVEKMNVGKYDIAVILNPTRIEQVLNKFDP